MKRKDNNTMQTKIAHIKQKNNQNNSTAKTAIDIIDYEFQGEKVWFQFEVNETPQEMSIPTKDFLDHMEAKVEIEARRSNEDIDLHISGTTYNITAEELFDDHTEEEDLIELIKEELATKVIQLPTRTTTATALKKTA